VLVALVALFLVYYNRIIRLKLKIENNLCKITILCKKRADLVPNLVQTVKGYASHEQLTYINNAQTRSLGQSANQMDAIADAKTKADASQTLSRLFAVSEANPELKADNVFLSLQKELKFIEDEIVKARKAYNLTILQYNKKVVVFPLNLLCKLFKFNKIEFFTVPEQEAVEVDFLERN
jgi:LemA protein